MSHGSRAGFLEEVGLEVDMRVQSLLKGSCRQRGCWEQEVGAEGAL